MAFGAIKVSRFVIAAFLIGGCAGKPAIPSSESFRVLQCTEGWGCVNGPEDTPLPSSTDDGHTQSGPALQPVTSPATAQQIYVGDIQGNVLVQETPDGNTISAQAGMSIPSGASIKTGNSSHAHLTIQPQGTAINIGQNTALIIKRLSSSVDGQVENHIVLVTGKIWILPRRGQVAIKTEIGTISSSGSPLGASYDPSGLKLEASCLEGICSLKNDEGEVILTSGMMATISAGHLPYSSEQMSGDILQEWVNENPDLKDYFGGNVPGWLPDPAITPGN